MKKKTIVVIGGGTGTVAVLSGLKKYPDLDIKVIVNMTDDGGSNKIVRDEFGLLPLSDLRKSIIALSNVQNGILREVFTYRFSKGKGLKGHTLGNLIMMGLTDLKGNEEEAIKSASKLFNIRGEIIPVTLDDVKLVVKYNDSTTVTGEHLIDEPTNANKNKRIKLLFTKPKATANPKAIRAILDADYIIIGPGDLYTSILANIVIQKIPEAIKESKAKVIYITNLMTKMGQTHDMKASDLVKEISKYCKRKPDIILINNKRILPSILKRYEKSKEFPIEDDLPKKDKKIIRASVISDKLGKRQKGDNLKRSLIRHDSTKLSKILYYKIFKNSVLHRILKTTKF